MTSRLAIDTGGTFTDFVLVDDATGAVRTLKTASTPPEFATGVIRGIDLLEMPLSKVRYIFHGSTMGVNAVIEERGEHVALLTTFGFEDILEIGWMNKPDMYNLLYTKPRPLVPRRWRKGIRERIGRDGEVLEPVDAQDVDRAVAELVQAGVRSLAICTINAFLNPTNERAIADIVRRAFPDLYVSISTDIVNQRREFERTSTAVLNAYLVPKFHRYFGQLESALAERGFAGDFFVMKSNGGVMPLDVARSYPIHTLLSGPVGGAIGCHALGRQRKLVNLIGFDMGGTSTDVSLVFDGAPQMTDQAMVHGYPVMGAAIDIGYIGAGGGSMARVEGLSSLRVGPQSAGASPGPVAYGRGGTMPCVTDANLILGRLDPDIPLADGIVLEIHAAAAALEEQIAARLHLDRDAAALGVVKIAEIKMAHAIRRMTIQQGLDPRDFALVAFGGAGPMHAASIAAQVGIPTVIVPPGPGTFSAWGMLNTDIRHDTVRTVDHAGKTVALEDLKVIFGSLEEEARVFLDRQGVGEDRIELVRTVDARYKGQEHTISLPFPSGAIDETALERFLTDFHALHERKYAHSRPDGLVEIVHMRVAGLGRLPRLSSASVPVSAAVARPRSEPVGSRHVVFDGWSGGVPIYARDQLSRGMTLPGPALIQEYGSITVLPPGFHLLVDSGENLVIDTRSGSA
jgi:N-methylhydantoinase A